MKNENLEGQVCSFNEERKVMVRVPCAMDEVHRNYCTIKGEEDSPGTYISLLKGREKPCLTKNLVECEAYKNNLRKGGELNVMDE